MTAPPYMRTWVDDYLTDTLELDAEEHGAYWLMLLHAWKHPECSLPLDHRKLARIARIGLRRWKSVTWPALERFWIEEDGRVWNPKQRKERAFTASLSESNSRKAKSRWERQPTEKQRSEECRGSTGADAGAMPCPESQSTLSTSVDNAEADEFDPTKAVFDQGVELLTFAGIDTDRRRREIVGLWRKLARDDDDLILAALSACQIKMPLADPLSWMNRAIELRMEKKRNDRTRKNDEPTDPYVRASLEREAARLAGTGE